MAKLEHEKQGNAGAEFDIADHGSSRYPAARDLVREVCGKVGDGCSSAGRAEGGW